MFGKTQSHYHSPLTKLKAKFELLTGRTMESIGQSQALDSDFACILSAALANEINFGRRPLCHPVISLHNAIKKANKKYRTKNAFPLAFPHERKKASISRRKKINKSMGRMVKKNLPPQCATTTEDGLLWESQQGKSIWHKDKTTRTSTKCGPHIIDTMQGTRVPKTQNANLFWGTLWA